MVLFNYATKEITAKIVYYGPGLCGKTTNLQFVYDSLPSNSKSKMLSLATKTDRTLFFDFLPLDLGKIRGMRTKLQLYTVPGQVYYNSTRQLVLKGADGVVFVADSQDFAVDANQESLQNLEDNLKRQGIRITEIPLVMQYNKRDLPNALPVEELEKELNARLKVPFHESVATTGLGVEETLTGITHLVLAHLVRKYGLEGSEPLEKEIQVLNARVSGVPGAETGDSVWSDDEPAASAEIPASAPVAPAAAASAGSGASPFLVEEDEEDDDIPMVSAELVAAPAVPAGGFNPEVSPFDDFQGSSDFDSPSGDTEVPITSVEMKLPENLLDSLPQLENVPTPAAPAPPPRPAAAPVAGTDPSPDPSAVTEPERRASDGLIKEVTLPLNLSISELKGHRKVRIRLTLDVNILP